MHLVHEAESTIEHTTHDADGAEAAQERAKQVLVRNRRKHWLDRNEDYYVSSSLELADPLLYDRLVRRFQSAEDREKEGRRKGWSGILETDIERSEAKVAALSDPQTTGLSYSRGADGEIHAEDPEDIPGSKEEGLARWKEEMALRFLSGRDDDFDYAAVDDNPEWDFSEEQRRDAEDAYFAEEEPEFLLEGRSNPDSKPQGETGIQDF